MTFFNTPEKRFVNNANNLVSLKYTDEQKQKDASLKKDAPALPKRKRKLKRSVKPTKSARTATPREAVIRAYHNWLRKKTRIESVVAYNFERWDWDKRDRALFQELLYGIIRWRGKIDWLIKTISNRSEITFPQAYAAITAGLYQLLYLDRIPDYAAVDSSVEFTRRAEGPIAAGLVNAVLRTVANDPEKWRDVEPEHKDIFSRLSIKHSHPQWMVERWSKLFAREKMESLLEWNNRRPDLCFRVNTRLTSADEIIEELKKSQIEPKRSNLDPNFLFIDHSDSLAAFELLEKGLLHAQDHSQGLVAKVVDPQPEEIILDLCAAPGGKTGYLAELCPECRIVATDKEEDRLNLVNQMSVKSGYDNVETKPYSEVILKSGKYDAILIDAPCTGTGVLSRRPDLRWRRIPAEIKRMSAVQLQLLKYAADRIKAGGRIIYSTCSIEPEENGEVIDAFLCDYRSFKEVKDLNIDIEKSFIKHGRLSILGPEVEGDGVFAAKIVKQK